MKRIIAVLVIAVLALICCACNPEDEADDLSVADAVAKGKRALSYNDGVDAARYFRYVRDKDAFNTDGAYGLVLANLQAMMNLVDSIVPYIDLFSGDPAAVEPEPAWSTGEAIGHILDTSALADFQDSESAFVLLEPARPLRFDLSRYEWWLGDANLLSVGGEFDRSDLYLFGSVNALLLGVLDVVSAHNLDLNLGSLAIPPIDLVGDPVGTLEGLSELLHNILDDPYFPDTLTMDEDGGPLMADAGVRLGDACDRLYRVFNELSVETDDQTDDPIGYFDDNANGRYDRHVDRVRMGDVVLSPEAASVLRNLGANLRDAFWEGSTADRNPLAVDRLTLGMLNELLVALGVLEEPILPDAIGFNIGKFFSDPHPAGLRGLVETLSLVLDEILEAA